MSYWERLARYRKEGPKGIDQPFALLPKDEFEAAVESAIKNSLEPGFQRAGKGTWERPLGPGITARVELRPLKGEATSAVWGIRLGFVPRLETWSGQRWWSGDQGTFDLSYDPLNYEPDATAWSISRFSTNEELGIDARAFAGRVASAVNTLVDPLTDLSRVRTAFEAKRARRGLRFGFEEYPQEMFAYACLLARLNEAEGAKATVSRLIDLGELPADQRAAVEAVLSKRPSS